MPIYGIREAARAIGVSASTLRWWVRGRDPFLPVIQLPNPSDSRLSFTNLVEAHVLSALRRQHQIRLGKIREAVEYVERRLRIVHPLASQKFETDGVDLFVEHFGQLLNVTRGGQLTTRRLLSESLKRVEYNPSGRAEILFPVTPFDSNRRPVSISPVVSFGRPVLTGTRIPTEILAERYDAGESLESLAEDYGQSKEDIEQAILFEQHAA